VELSTARIYRLAAAHGTGAPSKAWCSEPAIPSVFAKPGTGILVNSNAADR